MAMSQSTANWHWKTKYVSGWAKEWFSRELCEVSSVDGEETIKIERVSEVDGDVELGQRKSKLITIYDCKIVLIWTATGPNDTSAKGNLTIPEVSHENTIDGVSDYVYEYSTTDTSGESAAVAALIKRVKSVLPPLLEAKFQEFPKALVDTHGKDITVNVGENGTPSASGTTTPAKQAPAPIATKAPATKPTASSRQKEASRISTQTQRVSGHFQASAQDLWDMLTDERKMPIWSQAPAQSDVREGGNWSLLAGSVVGTYTSLIPAKQIVQQWKMPRAPGWPEDVWANLEINLNQGDDSTELEMVMTGVPAGKEEEVKQGLDNYYIRGFKSIGYVQVFPYQESPPSASRSKKAVAFTSENAGVDWKGFIALAVAGALLAATLVPTFIGQRPPSKY